MVEKLSNNTHKTIVLRQIMTQYNNDRYTTCRVGIEERHFPELDRNDLIFLAVELIYKVTHCRHYHITQGMTVTLLLLVDGNGSDMRSTIYTYKGKDVSLCVMQISSHFYADCLPLPWSFDRTSTTVHVC